MPRQLVRNQDLASDTARLNLLVNGGFERWQRGDGPFTGNGVMGADRWQNSIGGATTISVQRTQSIVDASLNAASITVANYDGVNPASIYQHLNDIEYNYQLMLRTMSFSCRVQASIANAVRLEVFAAGGVSAASAYHPGDGTWRTLTCTIVRNVNNGSTDLHLRVYGNGTVYADNAMLVVGMVPADYVPLHPADDLARCLRYYQRWNNDSSSAYWAVGSTQANATDHYSMLPFKAQFPGTPSFTYAMTVQMINAPLTASSPGPSSFTMVNNSLSTGLMKFTTAAAFNTAGAVCYLGAGPNGWFALEYNP